MSNDIRKMINQVKNLNENALVNRKYVSEFLHDFGYLITLNFSQITKMGLDVNATKELVDMMSNLRKPIINGLNYSELVNDVNSLFAEPKMLSGVLLKVRDYLVYIEPRVERFVVDGEKKTYWLTKINELKERYKIIIKN